MPKHAKATYQNGGDSNDTIHRSVRLSRVFCSNNSYTLSSDDRRTVILLYRYNVARNNTADIAYGLLRYPKK